MSETLTQNNPYVNRFEKMLEPLQLRLVELEKNLDSIKDDHPYKQQARLDVLEEISKTKQEIENTKKNLECSKTMNVIRSNKVPTNIQDHNVWNDCWYDDERKLYVTFNEYFVEGEEVWKRPHQIQYQKDTGVNAIIILPQQIEFRFGYPAILQKDSKERETWFLLSTMSDNMLTKEIVKARAKPTSNEDSILYETGSEQWITVGTDGFRMCERENQIADELSIFPPIPIEELKALYGRK